MAITITSLPNKKQKAMNISARKIETPDYQIIELDHTSLRILIAEKTGKNSKPLGVIETRAIYMAKALKSLGRSDFHRWETIKDEVFKQGCPIPKSGKPQGESFSKIFNTLLDDKIVERKVAPGGGYRLKITEAALKITDEDIQRKILANRNQKSAPSKNNRSD
jgi:hypothetical protein